MDDPAATAGVAPEKPYSLALSEDKMRLVLTCTAPVADVPQLLERIEHDLTEFPFTTVPDRKAWESRVTQAPLLPESQIPLLEGVQPVPPAHGVIEWTEDYFSEGFVVDAATGRADYRQRAAQRSVQAGQLLGRVVPPQDGQEGVDVLGRKIPVEKARPAKLRAGPNVRVQESDGTIYAEATGRIRLKDNLVAVDQVLTVEGSVGLASGNIRHPGALVVRGDIEAETVVETTGSIEVMGLIEPATIVCGGDLIVHGGITGAEGKSIQAGTVRAKFVLDSTIEAHGDVIAESEILHSQIRARGAVSCVRGRIIGGSIVAQRGIEAAQFGTETGTRTILHAGEDLELAAKLAALDEQLTSWKQQYQRIVERIAPLREHAERLDAKTRQALAKLEEQVSGIEAQIAAIQDDKRRLRDESSGQCRAEVYVYARAYADCFIRLADEHLHLSDTMLGPVCYESVDGAVSCRVLQGSQRGSHLIA